jgi:hypothetical protein
MEALTREPDTASNVGGKDAWMGYLSCRIAPGRGLQCDFIFWMYFKTACPFQRGFFVTTLRRKDLEIHKVFLNPCFSICDKISRPETDNHFLSTSVMEVFP